MTVLVSHDPERKSSLRMRRLRGASKSTELEVLCGAHRRLTAVPPALHQRESAAEHLTERGCIVANDWQAAATLGAVRSKRANYCHC
jgi:hypothetical protein